MSEEMNDELSLAEAALEELKARATMLGVKFHPSISAEKLREKLAEHAAAQEANQPAAPEPVVAAAETAGQKRKRLQDEQTKLVRVRLTCMNPNKREWEGELFSIGNNVVGTIKKYVPFNAPNGWHIPQIMLNMIQERQCQIFENKKAKNGVTVRQGKLIKEFAIEILDALTPEQLHDLAQQQAMAGRID